MSPPAPHIRPWPRVGPLRRYGPVVLIVAAVAGAGTLATVRAAGTGARAAGTASPARPAAGAAVPPTYALAAREGRTADYRWGQQCDPATGRLKIPTIYAPPCVPVFSGRGGGSTWNGVSTTSINVV